MHILMSFLFVGATASAHPLDLRISKCQMLLGHTVERVTASGEDTRWLMKPGIGPRGLVSSSWPPFDGPNDRNANNQTVFSWYHTIGVARSIEEAREHDRGLIPYKQMMYIITDRTLDDLPPTADVGDDLPHAERTRRHVLAGERAAELLRAENVKVVWFRNPTFEPEKHSAGSPWGGLAPLFWAGTEERVPRELVELEPAIVRAALHPDEMGVLIDDLGVRFVQHGWFLPPLRGIMTLENSFRRKQGGKTPESGEVKKAYDLLRRLVRLGWTVRINESIDDVIALEKATVHNVMAQKLGADGRPIPNSRYLEAHVEGMAREAFAAGDAFTFELRDPNGKLYASSIGFFGPRRLIMFDSVGGQGAPRAPNKENPEGGWIEEIFLRKAVMLGGLVWASVDLGYPFTDNQVVSNATAQVKCLLKPADWFIDRIFSGPECRRTKIGGVWTPPEYEAIYRAIDERARP